MDELTRRAVRLLCDHLRPLCEAELGRGNRVVNIAEHAWTECDLDVSLEKAIDKLAVEKEQTVPAGVTYWECDDPHYAAEAGYSCKACRHSFAGPKPK
jgi:hypothetical protein